MRIPRIDVRRGHIPRAELAGPSPSSTGEYERGVQDPGCRVAPGYLAARLLLQEREKSDVSRNEHPEPLPLALP